MRGNAAELRVVAGRVEAESICQETATESLMAQAGNVRLFGQTHLKSTRLLLRRMKSTNRKVAKVAEINAEFFQSHLFYLRVFLPELCISALRSFIILRQSLFPLLLKWVLCNLAS
jgi:hypothetical protein